MSSPDLATQVAYLRAFASGPMQRVADTLERLEAERAELLEVLRPLVRPTAGAARFTFAEVARAREVLARLEAGR